jgi:glycosyltransferase involved in cell wall biosynthesis
MVMVPGFTDEDRSSPQELIELVNEQGIPLLRPPDLSHIGGSTFWRDVRNITKLYKEAEADIIHIHTPNPHRTTRATLAAKLAGLPIVRSEHLPPSFWDVDGYKTKWGAKTIEWMSDVIVPGSDACYDEQIYLLKRNPQKVSQSCYGIELNRFNPDHDVQAAKAVLGLDTSLPVVGNIARLSPEKGQKYLIGAAARVIEEFGPVTFLIVGSGILEMELKQQVEDLGIEKFVQFAGYVRDTVPYMEAMDVTVMSSTNEGVSLAMLEFMAMGKPLVSSAEPSFMETVVDGESALLVDLEDSEKLSHAIIRLLEDPAFAKQLGDGALESVRARFDISISANEQMDIYDALLGLSIDSN